MKRMSIARLALALLLLGSMAAPAYAETLWYSGDYDLTANDPSYQINEILPNSINPTINDINARTYDGFVVPAVGWTINTLYSNNFLINTNSSDSITGAYWEIRQGVSAGNGGTLLLSGTVSLSGMSVDPTGRLFASDPPFSEVMVKVTNLNQFLSAGTYWLSVTPITSNAYDYIANSFTTGTSATGPGLNGSGFLCYSSPDRGFDFQYLDNLSFFGFAADYSMGIEGTVADPVPLPSSLLLLASALLALGLHGFRVRAC